MGNNFLGLADPAEMLGANHAELVAQNSHCGACARSMQVTQRFPLTNPPVRRMHYKRCMDSKCPDSVKRLVARQSRISTSPDYSRGGTPQAQCAPYG